jgi:hypothetical protein
VAGHIYNSSTHAETVASRIIGSRPAWAGLKKRKEKKKGRKNRGVYVRNQDMQS